MGISLINFVAPTGSGFGFFLTKCILWLAEVTSSIAVAVILFTLILKLLTLPADIYSRISTRKNSMIMEQMRPELEKLQKQYANDKVLYQQKVNALYKKNGYSMLGACLPSIVTLVIFIIAINAFNDFSKFQNRTYFYEMSLSYNEYIYEGFEGAEDYFYYDQETNTFVIEKDKILSNEQIKNASLDTEGTLLEGTEETSIKFRKFIPKANSSEEANSQTETSQDICNLELWVKDSFVKCIVNYNQKENTISYNGKKLSVVAIKDALNGKSVTIGDKIVKFDTFNSNAQGEKEVLFIEYVCASKAALTFRENVTSFLWVKNIWVTDSPMAHPVEKMPTNIADTESCGGCSGCACSSLQEGDWANNDIKNDYTKLISRLDKEQDAPNGYFILVLLTAGSSLLLQIITSKSQKAQAELQTVDGQGAMQQKMMTWMMPIMMALFAFMYTAAFSIYIILSSAISIGTTLLVNFILNKKFKPVLEGDNRPKDVIRGRVYTPKEEPKKDTKKSKKSKKNAIADNDFLSGKADKKYVRGRKK